MTRRVPPRLCEWVLSRIVPDEDYDAFVGDMRDEFAEEWKRGGPSNARRWYRRQTIASLLPLVHLRFRSSGGGGTGIARDLALVLRELARQPRHVLAVAGTMAIGCSAAIAVAGIKNATGFRQHPYAHGDRLVVVRSHDATRGDAPGAVAGPDYFDYRERLESLSNLVASELAPVTLRADDGTPRRATAALISVGTFDLLGVPLTAGRPFVADDGEPGAPAVVIARDGAGHDVGDSVAIDGVTHIVIGLAPAELRFPERGTELWRPLRIRRDSYNRRARLLTVLGTVASGHSLSSARAELDRVAAQLSQEHPETNATRRALVTPLATVGSEPLERPLSLLGWAALAVLTLAYTNAALLMLARATQQQRESMVRSALGATFSAELRRFIVEGTLLSLGGAALGVAIASVAWALIPRVAPPDTLSLIAAPLGGILGLQVIGGSVLLGGFVGGALGFPLARVGTQDAWRAGASGGHRVGAIHRALVVVQIATAVVLASSASLLVRSLLKLETVELGFRPEGAFVARIDLPATRYPTGMAQYPNWPQVHEFYERLQERLQQSRDVTSVGLSWHHPLATGFRMPYRVDGAARTADESRVEIRAVSPDYFATTGMKLGAGRFLSIDDRTDGREVAIVNEAFVRDAGLERAVGSRVQVFGRSWEIVGIVADVAPLAIGRPVAPAIYPPISQMPSEYFTVTVRTAEDTTTERAAGAIRETIAGIDPALAPYDIMSLGDVVRLETSGPRFAAALGVGLALIGALLAATGVLAIASLSVRLRRREIGICLALGASPGRIRREHVGRGIALAGAGLFVGIPTAMMTSRLLRGLLFGVGATDATTYLGVTGAVLAVAAIASYGPARQAALTDPRTSIISSDR